MTSRSLFFVLARSFLLPGAECRQDDKSCANPDESRHEATSGESDF